MNSLGKVHLDKSARATDTTTLSIVFLLMKITVFAQNVVYGLIFHSSVKYLHRITAIYFDFSSSILHNPF